MRWTAHIDGGPLRVNHAAVCIGDHIYSFGGYCSTEDYKDWDPIPVHVLNTATLRWSHVIYKQDPAVPYQRYGHSTVAYGHKVYMWGGRNNEVACVNLSCFDTQELVWTMPSVSGMIPFARDGHSACVIKNVMYIFGGFEYRTDQYSQDVHCLNLDTMHWTLMYVSGSIPCQRDFHTAVAYNNRMYIFGGRGDSGEPDEEEPERFDNYCDQLYYLDVEKEKWFEVNPNGEKIKGRRSHSAWLYKEQMYIFGGYNALLKQHFNDLYRYSFKYNRWEKLNVTGEAPCLRRRQVCIPHEDKVYLFGGTSPRPPGCDNPSSFNYIHEKLIDKNDLHVLDYSPSLKTLGILAVLRYKLDQTCLPRDIIQDILIMSMPNRISRPISQAG